MYILAIDSSYKKKNKIIMIMINMMKMIVMVMISDDYDNVDNWC